MNPAPSNPAPSNQVAGIPVADIRRVAAERHVDTMSDRDLISAVGDVLSVPRRGEPDSFVLHAPLELIARARLLPVIDPRARELARLHILAIAAQFEAFGPGLDGVRNAEEGHPGAEELLEEMPNAVVSSTAAAAHGSIYLAFLHELGACADDFANLASSFQHALDLKPDWRIRWHEDLAGTTRQTDAEELFAALVHAPLLGPPESTFIHRLMMRVDDSGVAAEVLGDLIGIPTTAAARVVMRVAALSMVHDNEEHAPYGWTHCLTLPQAVLRLGQRLVEPARAMAVAATQVLAFRASLGAADPDQPHLIRPVAVEDERRRAGALATAAATSHDAHVVKYALAVITAARDDPAAADLYLTAGEHLLDVWARSGGDPTDPLI